jgi:hypothetical protein
VQSAALKGLKDEILAEATDRFERRLGEECGKLRADMADMKHELKLEISNMKSELIKWSFLFWVGQMLGIASLLAVFVR